MQRSATTADGTGPGLRARAIVSLATAAMLAVVGMLLALPRVAEAHPSWTVPATIEPLGHPSPGTDLVASGVATSDHPGQGLADIDGVNWKRCPALWLCESVPNNHANPLKYTLTEEDVGNYVLVALHATDSADGAGDWSESLPFGPIQQGAPSSPTPPDPGIPSRSCTNPNATVADGYAGSTFASLRAQRNDTDTWVCFRLDAPGVGEIGGRVVIDDPAANAGMLETGPDPLTCPREGNTIDPNGVEGTIYGDPYSVRTYADSDEARVCLQVAGERQSIRVPLPGAEAPEAQLELDPASASSPAPVLGTAGYPSSDCQARSESNRVANMSAGPTHVWLYRSQPAPNRVELCVRAQGGGLNYGGKLVVDGGALGSPPQVTPHFDLDGCSLARAVTITYPVVAGVYYPDPTAGLPASVCVQAGAQIVRATVTGATTPSGQDVHWEGDPGTP